MGSVTPTSSILRNPNQRHLEINSVEGCKISSNKLLMKDAFDRAGIKHAKWFKIINPHSVQQLVTEKLNEYGTIIAKHKHSSKGNGIYLMKSIDDLSQIEGNVCDYIFEKYYTYSREYRIHVTKNGSFYASRKMLITGANDRWHRHSNNSVFINEDNIQFNKPSTWNAIVDDCKKALNEMNLDIAAFDVKVNRQGDWIILESNTAPSLKEQGIIKYTTALIDIINSHIS